MRKLKRLGVVVLNTTGSILFLPALPFILLMAILFNLADELEENAWDGIDPDHEPGSDW